MTTNNITRKSLLSGISLFIIAALAFTALAYFKKYSGHKTITVQEASNKVVTLTNKYFLPNKNATLSGKAVEESGLYKVELKINNNTQPFYITKNGASLIFPNGIIDIAKFEEMASKQKRQQAKNEAAPKTARPAVELFVMSLCPYGVKAEKDILPIIMPFGDKVDFKIKYIINVKGSTINDCLSLHGTDEAREDARQGAIMQYYPDKFASYIEKINANSCLISCGATKLEDYWKKSADELLMDVNKIETFAYGSEGLSLLRQNEADAAKYGADASPTLIINGVKSNAIYQGPQALRQAVCSAFANPPSECKDSPSGT